MFRLNPKPVQSVKHQTVQPYLISVDTYTNFNMWLKAIQKCVTYLPPDPEKYLKVAPPSYMIPKTCCVSRKFDKSENSLAVAPPTFMTPQASRARERTRSELFPGDISGLNHSFISVQESRSLYELASSCNESGIDGSVHSGIDDSIHSSSILSGSDYTFDSKCISHSTSLTESELDNKSMNFVMTSSETPRDQCNSIKVSI